MKRTRRSEAGDKRITPSQSRRGGKGPGTAAVRAPNGANPGRTIERYLALAREAEASGDAVQSQHYYQHAEHYFRKAQRQG